MYSVVLATVLVAGSAAPDFGWSGGCHGCYGAAYGGCYGVCYGGYASCSGGCYGGCGGCYGGCCGCWGGSSCYGGWSCCGGCYGGCCGSWSCCGGCYGGCCGGSSCYGGCGSCCGGWSSCSGCGGCYGSYSAAPAVTYSAPAVTYSAPALSGHSYAAPSNGRSYSAPSNGGYSITPSNGGHSSGTPVYSAPINGGHAQPAPANPLPQPSNGHGEITQSATVVIKASSDVKILVNGKETTRKKDEETFKTPDLKAGKTYAYDVKAEVSRDGKTYTASKRVLVRAGERSEINFGDMSEVIAEAQSQTARVTVLLPEGGKLFVDGKEQGNGKASQTFDTPKLTKGKAYHYTFKVEVNSANNAGAKTQRVNVEAGKEVTVDFRLMFVSTAP